MIQGIMENAGTIVISLALIGLVALIIHQLRMDKKQGKSPCGGKCACCPMASSCHKPS